MLGVLGWLLRGPSAAVTAARAKSTRRSTFVSKETGMFFKRGKFHRKYYHFDPHKVLKQEGIKKVTESEHGRKNQVMHQILSDRKFIAWGHIPYRPKERRWNYPL